MDNGNQFSYSQGRPDIQWHNSDVRSDKIYRVVFGEEVSGNSHGYRFILLTPKLAYDKDSAPFAKIIGRSESDTFDGASLAIL